MMTGRPVSRKVKASVPPLRSYRSTCSATHARGLGLYSLTVISFIPLWVFDELCEIRLGAFSHYTTT
jgi:hypothetical protein